MLVVHRQHLNVVRVHDKCMTCAAILAKVNEYKMRKAEEAEGKDVTGVTATGTLPEEENIYFVQDEVCFLDYILVLKIFKCN